MHTEGQIEPIQNDRFKKDKELVIELSKHRKLKKEKNTGITPEEIEKMYEDELNKVKKSGQETLIGACHDILKGSKNKNQNKKENN